MESMAVDISTRAVARPSNLDTSFIKGTVDIEFHGLRIDVNY